MGKKLFEDEDERGNDDMSNIEINEEFARRYEHNKRREDLHRYEELKKKGLIPSDSDSEEDEDEEEAMNPNEDIKFFDKLIKVRNRDPSIFENKDAELFDSDSGSSDDEDGGNNKNDQKNKAEKKKTKKKAMFLKDVVARNLMDAGPDFDDDNDTETGDNNGKAKTYHEEQEELRRAFLDAVSQQEGEHEGHFLIAKEKKDDEESGGLEFENKVGEYFGREGDLDENERFLKEFFTKKMWVDKDGKRRIDEEEVEELIQDELEIERQEKFEEEMCYRHEEVAGDRVLGHSRVVEGSVRKKKNPRKEQRERRKERLKNAEKERQEDLKHLKNVKKQEMLERMSKVLQVAGMKDEGGLPLDLDDLEEEFDPKEYDQMMKKAFDDKYYEAEDVDSEFGSDHDGEGGDLEKPDFDKADEMLGLPKGWEELSSGDGFSAARERFLKMRVENGDLNNQEEEEEEEEEGEDENEDGDERNGEEESKRNRKRKVSLLKKAKDEMLEEYYKLDYEDTIGDLKTRFRYSKVDPNRYGLKPTEMLMLDDKELNQFVSLKKLATYREKEWKMPNSKRHQFKMRIRELLKGKSDGSRIGKKKKKHKVVQNKIVNELNSSMASSRDGKAGLEGSHTNAGNVSKKAKRRRRRQEELKLSQSRRMAYVQAQPKNKNKENK